MDPLLLQRAILIALRHLIVESQDDPDVKEADAIINHVYTIHPDWKVEDDSRLEAMRIAKPRYVGQGPERSA